MFFSVVIATHNRKDFLHNCLISLEIQKNQDFEIIIAHSGVNDGTRELCDLWKEKLPINYFVCPEKGAATQRNFGVNKSNGEWIVFLDDDVVLEPECLEEIKKTIDKFPGAVGVSARISNQYFEPVSSFKRILLRLAGVPLKKELAGKAVGPALNFLPEKTGEQFEEVDWMPCVCAYPKQLLIKMGIFPAWFKEYSFGEDLYISLKMGQLGALILNRNAVLFHNDQGGKDHTDWEKLGYMQMVNRLYIMKHVLSRSLGINRVRLWIWYSLGALLPFIKGKKKLKVFLSELKGYSKAIFANIA